MPQPSTAHKKREKAVIEIIESRCKGCEICVEFCPTNVLEMNGLIAVVKNIDACTKCMMCELLCPDFAIYVR